MHVPSPEKWRPAELAASADRNFTRIQVDRMREKLADRNPALHVDVGADIQALKQLDVAAAELIAAVDVDDVAAVGVERPDGELVAEQVEVAGGEVEQRADARVGLTVVIAQVTLEVAFEFRNTPIARQLPAIGEAFVQLYLHRFVITHRIGETVRLAIRLDNRSVIVIYAGLREADALAALEEKFGLRANTCNTTRSAGAPRRSVGDKGFVFTVDAHCREGRCERNRR